MAAGVYVTNLAETRRWIRKFHPSLVPVFRDELKRAADSTVVPRIRAKVPKRSGAAAASVRARSGGNTIYVVAGSARAPYFGWLDFGGTLRPSGRRHNTQTRPVAKSGRYVYPGIAQSERTLVEAAGKAVDQIIRSSRTL